MALRSLLVSCAATSVLVIVYGCSSSPVATTTPPIVDASTNADRNVIPTDSVCPNAEVPGGEITRSTATLTFRPTTVGACSPTEVSAYRNLSNTATLAEVIAALPSDTCRRCAFSDVEDDVWGLLIFGDTKGTDGGVGRAYNNFIRPNNAEVCFAANGSQGCGRYLLRRQLCADNTCDSACPTETAYDACLDTVFSAQGACTLTERTLAWDSECPEATFDAAFAVCQNVSGADILNQVCGTGTLGADGGTPSDAGAD